VNLPISGFKMNLSIDAEHKENGQKIIFVFLNCWVQMSTRTQGILTKISMVFPSPSVQVQVCASKQATIVPFHKPLYELFTISFNILLVLCKCKI
jgi:hypothetical protein